jgi:hypothetical protein
MSAAKPAKRSTSGGTPRYLMPTSAAGRFAGKLLNSTIAGLTRLGMRVNVVMPELTLIRQLSALENPRIFFVSC